MPITFMLKPRHVEYWALADDNQQAALQEFCKQNHLQYNDFTVPGGEISGVLNRPGQLRNKPYDSFTNADKSCNVYTYAQHVDRTSVFIKYQGMDVLACPFDARYVHPSSYAQCKIPSALRIAGLCPPSLAGAAKGRHSRSSGGAGSDRQSGGTRAHGESLGATRYAVFDIASRREGARSDDKDPFHLQRFLNLPEKDFERAVSEIKSGKKEGHWIYYYVPTPPYVQNGKERGTDKNQYWALRDSAGALDGVQAARAFVDNEILCQRLVEMYRVIHAQLYTGQSAKNLLEHDRHKLLSSVLLFHQALENSDSEKHRQVSRLCAGILHAMLQGEDAPSLMMALEKETRDTAIGDKSKRLTHRAARR